MVLLNKPWSAMVYEEFNKIELDEEKSKIFLEYVGVIRQLERIMLDQKIYGHPSDDFYNSRRQLLKEFYQTIFQNPFLAVRMLDEYEEPAPSKSIYLEGHETFLAWKNGIADAFRKTKMYELSKTNPDLRKLFLSLLNLKSTPFSDSFIRTLPKNAKLVEGSTYSLDFGIEVAVYYLEGQDTYLYTQRNPEIENLPSHLTDLLNEAILNEIKKLKEQVDYKSYYSEKLNEFRTYFLDICALRGYEITPQTASAMAREAANWSVGLGSPVENIALDYENVTDIYIDSQNAALYIEHKKYGICHTPWSYDKETLERMFLNILSSLDTKKRFDEQNPVIDIMLPRLAMRCHLQRPPATFGDLQAALRIMNQEPFTYPQYLVLGSLSPFFAGYDDLMVSLGCSEAVLGLKGVGKTAFTAAKISAIGPKKRILPIEDIEEIPVNAYRKHGFHIGAIRVAASDRDEVISTNELDLVSMTNAALRMGDACVIINEIRSRTAIQGVINLLNTQPGIFLLYNLHAQSLKDIQDRLELVFGIPSSSMYSTDRYTFLRKVYFDSREVNRLVGSQFESNFEQREFTPVFNFLRGTSLQNSKLECLFCKNPEASASDLSKLNLSQIAKDLNLSFVPPALKRRCDETNIDPKNYILYAFFKGKLYSLIKNAYLTYKNKSLVGLEFVLKCMDFSNKLILPLLPNKFESIDWAKLDEDLLKNFAYLLERQLSIFNESNLESSSTNDFTKTKTTQNTKRKRKEKEN
jgi:type IV secretory pathway ATPase VirB11/archaellum biosynthesis ATPase